MEKLEWVSFEEMKVEALTDSDFAKEFDALREEFALAREVIELRKQRNMTQKELAEKAGTSQPAIARLESGRYRNVSLAFLRKVGKALGVQPEVHLRAQV
jgi:DNA-binding Xre family transcriptional regulator